LPGRSFALFQQGNLIMDMHQATKGVHRLITDRWSPRAFDSSKIDPRDLEIILEAAGLAPSAFNYQPWRFLYSHREGADWGRFVSLLNPFNQSWAQNASALVFVISDMNFEQGEATTQSYSHSFDAGAAWAQMALQASALRYHAHAMIGIEFDRIRSELNVPPHFRIEAAVAIGRRASPDTLPEALREREAPSGRKPIDQIAFAGAFPS
jgi:nitroreductase